MRDVLQPLRRLLYRYRTRGAVHRTTERTKLRAAGFFSQWGQDKYLVEEVFRQERAAVFLDIGAHDGVTFSNTCYLERELGWTGVAVEPNLQVFEALRANRRCVTINGCVSDRLGEATFLVIDGYPEMLSGLVERYDPRHRSRVEQELREYGGTATEMKVPCFTVAHIAQQHGLKRIDYLSVDTEGGEYEILRSIDFDALSIRVVSVENNFGEPRFHRLMHERGYDLVAVVGDEIYIRRSR